MAVLSTTVIGSVWPASAGRTDTANTKASAAESATILFIVYTPVIGFSVAFGVASSNSSRKLNKNHSNFGLAFKLVCEVGTNLNEGYPGKVLA